MYNDVESICDLMRRTKNRFRMSAQPVSNYDAIQYKNTVRVLLRKVVVEPIHLPVDIAKVVGDSIGVCQTHHRNAMQTSCGS